VVVEIARDLLQGAKLAEFGDRCVQPISRLSRLILRSGNLEKGVNAMLHHRLEMSRTGIVGGRLVYGLALIAGQPGDPQVKRSSCGLQMRVPTVAMSFRTVTSSPTSLRPDEDPFPLGGVSGSRVRDLFSCGINSRGN